MTIPVIVPPGAADNEHRVITKERWLAQLASPAGGQHTLGRQPLIWDGRNEDRIAAPGVYGMLVFSAFELTVSRIVRVP